MPVPETASCREALARLLEADQDAADEVRKAHEEAEELVEEAREDADRLVEKRKEEADGRARKILKEADSAFDEEKSESIARLASRLGVEESWLSSPEKVEERFEENRERSVTSLIAWVTLEEGD